MAIFNSYVTNYQRVHVFLSPCFGVSWFPIQFWESISVILMTLVTFKPYNYVYINVHIKIYIYIYASIPTFMCLYEYLYLSIYTHMFIYIYVCVCVYLETMPAIESPGMILQVFPRWKTQRSSRHWSISTASRRSSCGGARKIPLSIDHRYPSEKSGWHADMCIYVYVCMYVSCMYVCIYVCVCVCVCVYVYVYVYVYVCMYVCTYVRMYVCTYVGRYVCMYVRTYVCMYVRR